MTDGDIGLMGLAVMGQNLVLNMADKGYRVSVYNRTTSKVDQFVNSDESDSNIQFVTEREQIRPATKAEKFSAGKAIPVELV